jgi:hypothetical protein
VRPRATSNLRAVPKTELPASEIARLISLCSAALGLAVLLGHPSNDWRLR